MKKLNQVGRILSKQEQKSIVGGYASCSFSCNCGSKIINAHCSTSPCSGSDNVGGNCGSSYYSCSYLCSL